MLSKKQLLKKLKHLKTKLKLSKNDIVHDIIHHLEKDMGEEE